jgi:surface antigen
MTILQKKHHVYTTMNKKIISLVMITTLLAGCNMGPGQGLGQIAGGGIGALLGSQIGGGRGRLVATAIGAVLGATAGGMIGKGFDEGDKKEVSYAASDALNTGQPTQWTNPHNGHRGEIRPQPVYYDQGRPCRKFSHLAYIDGKPVTIHGTAYQAQDGSWHVNQ